jgi:hypothetical protein
MPDEQATTDEQVAEYEALLGSIQKPLTDEEARALVPLFGRDNYYGLAFTLVHLIESAPHWPLKDSLTDDSNVWVRHLRDAAWRAGLLS